MSTSDIEILKYRRQYLIAPKQIECPFIHQKTALHNNYILYSHPDLPLTVYTQGENKLILLGDMFDYIHPESDNHSILKDLYDIDYEQFLEKTSRYTGRFVLVYQNINQIYLVSDATAARKVFYFHKESSLCIASQSHLLANVLGLSKTTNKSKLAYYHSLEFSKRDLANIGNTTYYDEIRQLLPNHYLSINEFQVSRFWPKEKIKIRPLGEVAEDCAKLVKGYMEAIACRYNAMLPVTAGKDSRLLLAGTRDIPGKFFHYINRDSDLAEKSTDFIIPKKLFKKLDSSFHILDLPAEVDADFRKVYFENNPLATAKFLPHIYNYYLHYQDKVNLPGNFAAHPWGLNKLKENEISGEALSKLIELSDYGYAAEYYEKWLEDSRHICNDCNIRIISLFYWEEKIANWATQTQLDKDIAQEDINPFNSRMLISLFYSVNIKYNSVPDYLLHRKIIEILWPELLKVPINPSFKKRIRKGLKMMGLIGLISRIKHRLRE